MSQARQSPGHTEAVTRVVIADDHAIVRAGLSDLMAKLGIAVAGEAADGFQAIALVKSCEPDAVLLDISMPFANGTEVIQELRRWSPDTKIVVYTGVSKASVLAALVDMGVDGIFLKGAELAELEERFPLIIKGAHYVSQAVADRLVAPSPVSQLTAREIQVMYMLLGGKSNRNIAALLNISPKTVDKHRTNLMSKLDLHSFTDLMQYALRHDLIGSQSSEV